MVLYDVTSTYFEGHTCPLAKFGHSRDGKKDELQIVVGLLTNGEGCPVAVEVFEGNTGDPTTVASQVTKLKSRFNLERAESKALSKKTSDGEPVHSFKTLLRDLATVVKNRVQPKVEGVGPFDITTTPTTLQKRAIDLLKIHL